MRGDVHRGGVEGAELVRLAGTLDPVDAIILALGEERRDPEPRVPDAAAHLLELGLRRLVLHRLERGDE